jgi:hypothetical protein
MITAMRLYTKAESKRAWCYMKDQWRELVRVMRLYYAERVIFLTLRLLPYGEERVEFARFITGSWMARITNPRRKQSGGPEQVESVASQPSADAVVTVVLDGRTIAEVIVPHLQDAVKHA